MDTASGQWRVRAVLHEANGELRLGLTAQRSGDTTSDLVIVANESEARHEAGLYARMLGAATYEWVDQREKATC